MIPWSEMFPEGRHIFYEGNDPAGFVSEMRTRFKFDPSKNNPHWSAHYGFSFHCPVDILDEVYGSGKYPMGS